MGSAKFSLNTTDMVRLFKNASLVGAAAALTYVGQNMSSLNLGASAALVVPIVAFVIEAAVKWAKDNTKEV